MMLQGSSMDTLLSPQKQLQKQLPPDIAMAGAQWGCYSSPAALDGLLEWLNPKGEQPCATYGSDQQSCWPGMKMQLLHLPQQQMLPATARLTLARACAGQREGPLRRKIAEHRRTLPSPKAQA